MDTDLVLNTGIENISTVYGGVRGTTLSSRRNMRHWPSIAKAGVKTVIELREEDSSSRLCKMCERYGIHYFAFPMDSHNVPDELIAEKLEAFFHLIDKGDFYIACAMGLHRTDMALSVYWMFHGAELGMDPPILRGHIEDGEFKLNRLNNKVFRRLNSLYAYLSENNMISIPNRATFIELKNKLINHNYETAQFNLWKEKR